MADLSQQNINLVLVTLSGWSSSGDDNLAIHLWGDGHRKISRKRCGLKKEVDYANYIAPHWLANNCKAGRLLWR